MIPKVHSGIHGPFGIPRQFGKKEILNIIVCMEINQAYDGCYVFEIWTTWIREFASPFRVHLLGSGFSSKIQQLYLDRQISYFTGDQMTVTINQLALFWDTLHQNGYDFIIRLALIDFVYQQDRKFARLERGGRLISAKMFRFDEDMVLKHFLLLSNTDVNVKNLIQHWRAVVTMMKKGEVIVVKDKPVLTDT